MSEQKEKDDWEVQRDAYKALADNAFRSGNYREAIQEYTHALGLDPTNYLILSNRSAANLKASNKSKAFQDAKACIEAMPKFAKGYSRLAAAQVSLGRWKDALASYEKCQRLDPSNAISRKGIDDCKEAIKKKQEEEQKILEEHQKTAQEEKEKKEESATEEDMLDDFFSEVEKAEEKPKVVEEEEAPKAIQNYKKDLGTAADQVERLLAPNYKWRNLNPFYVLQIPHTVSDDDVSRRYKALSLLLHPDKCRDIPNAKEAYDEVQRAKSQLNNEDKARHLRQLVEEGYKNGEQLWRRNKKKEKLEDVQSKEVQRIFAQIEYKRKEVEKRERQYEQRERDQEDAETMKEKKEMQFNKNWRQEGRVEKRIGNWRDFQKKKKTKGDE